MRKFVYIVGFFLFLATSSSVHAVQFTKTFSWNSGDNWYQNNANPVIVRIFANGIEIGQTYDNGQMDTRTTLQTTFDVSVSRFTIIANAEWASGPVWEPSTTYVEGEIVVATSIFGHGYVYFECTRAGTSGASEPVWSTTNGDIIEDPDVNGVQWTVHNIQVATWQPNTAYEIGDMVVPTTYKLPGGYVLRAMVAGTSGQNEPDWSTYWSIPWFAFFQKWFVVGVVNANGVEWQQVAHTSQSDPSKAIKVFFTAVPDASVSVGRSRN